MNMNREIKFKAWDKQAKKMIKVSDIHQEDYCLVLTLDGTLLDIAFSRDDVMNGKVELLQWTGLRDKEGTEIYEGDIIKWNTGIGFIKYVADDYSLGFEVELIAGSKFYDYDYDQISWGSVEVIGNIHSHLDLIEKYKYGVTPSFKPLSREDAKKKFVDAVKKGMYKKGQWVPTQAIIPERIGIQMNEVVTELREELVKEGKLIQDPNRYWMCKVPELLEGE